MLEGIFTGLIIKKDNGLGKKTIIANNIGAKIANNVPTLKMYRRDKTFKFSLFLFLERRSKCIGNKDT